MSSSLSKFVTALAVGIAVECGAAVSTYTWNAGDPQTSFGDGQVVLGLSGSTITSLTATIPEGDEVVFTGDGMTFAADAVVCVIDHGALTFSNDVAAAGAIVFKGDLQASIAVNLRNAPWYLVSSYDTGATSTFYTTDLDAGQEGILLLPGMRHVADYRLVASQIIFDSSVSKKLTVASSVIRDARYEDVGEDSVSVQVSGWDNESTWAVRPMLKDSPEGFVYVNEAAWRIMKTGVPYQGENDLRDPAYNSSKRGNLCVDSFTVVSAGRKDDVRVITLAGTFAPTAQIAIKDGANVVFGKGSVSTDGTEFAPAVDFDDGSLTFVDPGDFTFRGKVTGKKGDVRYWLSDAPDPTEEIRDFETTDQPTGENTVLLPNTELSAVTGVAAAVLYRDNSGDTIIPMKPQYCGLVESTLFRNTGKEATVWFNAAGKNQAKSRQAALQLTQVGKDVMVKKIPGRTVWHADGPTSAVPETWNPYDDPYSTAPATYAVTQFDFTNLVLHLNAPTGHCDRVRNHVTLAGTNTVLNGRYTFAAGRNRRLDVSIISEKEGPCGQVGADYAEIHVKTNTALHITVPVPSSVHFGVNGSRDFGVRHIVYAGGAVYTKQNNKQVGTSQTLELRGGTYGFRTDSFLRKDLTSKGSISFNTYVGNIIYADGAHTFGSSPSLGWDDGFTTAFLRVTGDKPCWAENPICAAMGTAAKNATLTLDIEDVTKSAEVDFTEKETVSGWTYLHLVKTGAGTIKFEKKCEVCHFPFELKAGTVLLGATDTVEDEIVFAFDGGSLALASGATNTVKSLSIAAGGSIELAEGAALQVSDCSGEDWSAGGIVNIVADIKKSDIRFGDSSDALTAAQLGHLRLNGRKFLLDDSGRPVPTGMLLIVR